MVYESDFYTTRRPYRTTPSYSTYTTSKREIPWEKVPFVPRPRLVPDPITAFGKKPRGDEKSAKPQKVSILDPAERAKIKPAQYLMPLQDYRSARDLTRERVFGLVRRNESAYSNNETMDVVLPRLHKVAELPDLPYKRRMVAYSDLTLPI